MRCLFQSHQSQAVFHCSISRSRARNRASTISQWATAKAIMSTLKPSSFKVSLKTMCMLHTLLPEKSESIIFVIKLKWSSSGKKTWSAWTPFDSSACGNSETLDAILAFEYFACNERFPIEEIGHLTKKRAAVHFSTLQRYKAAWASQSGSSLIQVCSHEATEARCWWL